VRRRKQKLDDARQALFSARFSSLREVKTAEQQAVHRAEKALEEAEVKFAAIKRWSSAFEQQVGPLLKQVEQLRTMSGTTLTRAEEYLGRILGALDEYALPPAQAESKTAPESNQFPGS